MFDDNWGCVEPSELFSSAGKTQSLSYLVEQLQQGTSTSAYDGLIDADRQFPVASTSKDASGDGVQIITNGVRPSTSGGSGNGRPPMAPRILKQKRGLVERPPSLKRVTFEVERFVVDSIEDVGERQSAETRLAVRLGAKPERRPAANYKALVAERTAERAAETAANGHEVDQMSAATALVKLVANKKSKSSARKTKNGHVKKPSVAVDAATKRKK